MLLLGVPGRDGAYLDSVAEFQDLIKNVLLRLCWAVKSVDKQIYVTIENSGWQLSQYAPQYLGRIDGIRVMRQIDYDIPFTTKILDFVALLGQGFIVSLATLSPGMVFLVYMF
jgi:hypothetical protein